MTLNSFELLQQKKSIAQDLEERLKSLIKQSGPIEEITKLLAQFQNPFSACEIVDLSLEHNPKLIYPLLENPILARAVTGPKLRKVGSLQAETRLRLIIADNINIARSISVGQVVDWAIQFKEESLINKLIHSPSLIEALDPFYVRKLATHLPYVIVDLWPTLFKAYQNMQEPRQSLWMKEILRLLGQVPAFSMCLEEYPTIFQLAKKLDVDQIKLWALCCFKKHFETTYGSCTDYILSLHEQTLADILNDHPSTLNLFADALESLKQKDDEESLKRYHHLINAMLEKSIGFKQYCIHQNKNLLLDLASQKLHQVNACLTNPQFIKGCQDYQLLILFKHLPCLRKCLYLNEELRSLINIEDELKHDSRLTGNDYTDLGKHFFEMKELQLSALCYEISSTFYDQPIQSIALELFGLYIKLENCKKATQWFSVATMRSDPNELFEACQKILNSLDNPDDLKSLNFNEQDRAHIRQAVNDALTNQNKGIEEDLIHRIMSLDLSSHRGTFEEDLETSYHQRKAPLLTRRLSDSNLPALKKKSEAESEFLFESTKMTL